MPPMNIPETHQGAATLDCAVENNTYIFKHDGGIEVESCLVKGMFTLF